MVAEEFFALVLGQNTRRPLLLSLKRPPQKDRTLPGGPAMRERDWKGKDFWTSVVLVCALLAGGSAWSQVRTFQPGEYPAPKDPPYKLNVTVEDLLPIACVHVRKPAKRQPLVPGYAIKPGQRVVIFVASTFDDTVLEAIRRAIGEAGGKPDAMKSWAPERRIREKMARDAGRLSEHPISWFSGARMRLAGGDLRGNRSLASPVVAF